MLVVDGHMMPTKQTRVKSFGNHIWGKAHKQSKEGKFVIESIPHWTILHLSRSPITHKAMGDHDGNDKPCLDPYSRQMFQYGASVACAVAGAYWFALSLDILLRTYVAPPDPTNSESMAGVPEWALAFMTWPLWGQIPFWGLWCSVKYTSFWYR